MKESIKKRLTARVKTGGFLFALAGWIMLVAVPLEMGGRDLSRFEIFVKDPVFSLGLKIFVIAFLIFLIKGQKNISDAVGRYKWLKIALKIIFLVGAAGWIVGLGSLLID